MNQALQAISGINIFVEDYEQAKTFYHQVLGFQIVEDIELSPEQRWLTVTPAQGQTRLILAKAQTDTQRALVGKQAGDSVLMILSTANFDQTYQDYLDKGVEFVEEPRVEPYGKVVIFKDLYGNKFDLIQPA